jgi:competence protein ComEC
VGTAVAWCAALPLRALLRFVPALGKLPYAAVTLSSVYYALWLLFAYAVLAMYLLWRGEKKRPVLPTAAVAAVLCAAVVFTRLSALSGGLTVTVLDVGQGQCVLLQSGGVPPSWPTAGAAARKTPAIWRPTGCRTWE